MNRIIKFRAWIKPSQNKKGRMVEIDEIWFSKNRIKEQNQTEHSLMDSILIQFTGLTDKNGKEIFEGDIVRALNKNYTVNYVSAYYGLQPVPGIEREDWEDIPQINFHNVSFMEVIGNIYENKL